MQATDQRSTIIVGVQGRGMEENKMDEQDLTQAMLSLNIAHKYPAGFDKEFAKELEKNGVVYHYPGFSQGKEVDSLFVDKEKLKSLYGIDIDDRNRNI